MNLEELKEVELTTVEDFDKHLEDVLALESDDLNEYVLFALDTYYKTEEEGENEEKIEKFFSNDKFKEIYKLEIDAE